MGKPEPSVESGLADEKDFSIFVELGKQSIEDTKNMIGALMGDNDLEKEGRVVKGLETIILRNRILETIRYVFDDEILEVKLQGIYLQGLGQRSFTMKVNFSHPSTILAFRNHLRDIIPEAKKSKA